MRDDEESGGEAARDALNARKTRSTVEEPGQAPVDDGSHSGIRVDERFRPDIHRPAAGRAKALPDERVDPAWLRRRIGAFETFARYVTATR